jgi:hypothetical protein
MDSIVRSLAQFLVWALIFIGCACMILSPVARYATGEELYLWIALGTSFVALMLALGVYKLAQARE